MTYLEALSIVPMILGSRVIVSAGNYRKKERWKFRQEIKFVFETKKLN